MKRSFWLLVLIFCAGCRGSRDDKRIVADVGGTPILADDFNRRLKRLRLDTISDAENSAKAAQERALLDNLIERRLLSQEAERKNVVVSSEEVEAMYARTRSGWKEEEYQSALSEKDLTPGEFKNELRELLLIRKYLEAYVFSRVAVTDTEINDYLEAHSDELIAAEEVRARQILVKSKEEAERIAQELKGKLAFEDAAMKYSLSPEAKTGGDLGFFPRGVMPKIFDENCFTLPVGQVSKVVESEYGFHLFKVIEKHPEGQRSLDGVRKKIEAQLRREKEQNAQAVKVAELKQNTAIKVYENELTKI